MEARRRDDRAVRVARLRLEEDFDDLPFTCLCGFAFGLLGSVGASLRYNIVDIAFAT